MSRWASRRLFERLIALDALRAKLRSRHVEDFLALTRCMTARQKRSGAGEETQILGRMSADHTRSRSGTGLLNKAKPLAELSGGRRN